MVADKKEAPPPWVERHTAVPMAIASALGILLSWTLGFSFERWWCVTELIPDGETVIHQTGFCEMVRRVPPWYVVSGVAAAPSILLTWFWRTSDRKRERRQKDRENELKTRELDQLKESSELARFDKDFTALQRAIENLDSQDPQTIGTALDTIERTGVEKMLRVRAVDALCTFLRSRVHEVPVMDFRESARGRQRAISLTCFFRAGEQELDLQSAYLHELDLSGLDLRGANLRAANLKGSKMHGTLLAGAHLNAVMAEGCEFNEQTQIDELERKHLMDGKARFVNTSRDPGNA